MTNQEKKRYLKQYWQLNARINRLTLEESEWRQRATSVTAASDGMPRGSGVSDKVGSASAKIADLRAEINREIDRMVDLRREIETAIHTVQDDTLRDLLEYKYIEGWTLEQIAVEMHYSYVQTCRRHGKALTSINLQDDME